MGCCEILKTVLIVKIACNIGNGPENCQLNIVDLEGTLTQVNIYCLSTIGTINMISESGNTVAKFSDNVNAFPDLIALFQLAAGTGGSGMYILSSPISRIWHSDYVPRNTSRQYGNCIINSYRCWSHINIASNIDSYSGYHV
jgi:hypothetical protein